MKNFENIGTDPAEANKQLQGLEIKGDVDSLEEEYSNLFEGVESKSLDELFKEFGDVLRDVPEDVLEEIDNGDTDLIEERAKNVWKWSAKKVKQFIVFTLIASATTPAFAQGKEDTFQGLETVQSRIAKLRVPQKIVFGKGVIVAPTNKNAQFEQEYNQYNGNISINGEPARVIYSDNSRVVLGGSDSIYEKNADGGEIAVGTVIIE